MLLESYILNSLFPEKEGFDGTHPNIFKGIITFLLQLFIIIIATYLAWDCNKNQTRPMRIFITILAVLFSGIYILFYLLYRIILKVECK